MTKRRAAEWQSPRRISGIRKAGNQQVSAYLAVGKIAESMSQSLSKRFHGSLAHVIGSISRRRSNALFGAGVDNETGVNSIDHNPTDELNAIEHTQNIDVQYTSPALRIR